MMFCSDDKHPDSLVEGHINLLVKRALKKGLDLFNVLQAACINPVEHYNMDVGLLRKGDSADFIVINDLQKFDVLETWINGEKVASRGTSNIDRTPNDIINNFSTQPRSQDDFELAITGKNIRIMEALEGQLITNLKSFPSSMIDNPNQTNIDEDILKIAVVNRYKNAPVAVGLIQNIGLKTGAIASSVGHDSHNIVVVGVDSESMCKAVNLIIEQKGGVSAVGNDKEMILGLPVAGIMSERDGYDVAHEYSAIDQFAKTLGSKLNSPFMTLSFMALLVIPKAKMSDLGFFDGEKFEFIDVFYD
jgi:adenine deaminase